jgi:hypothetical protein
MDYRLYRRLIGWLMNYDEEIIWKGAIVAYFEVPSRYSTVLMAGLPAEI